MREILEKIIKYDKNIKHSIYVLKILLLCINDQENDEKLKYVERIYRELTKSIEQVKKIEDQETLESNQELSNQIMNDFESIMNILSEIKEDVFPQFKLASVIVIDNMSNDLLKTFYAKTKEILKKFKNISEASDYLFYHSGEEISSFIDTLLKYVKNHAPERILRLIPIQYLESKKTIITLSYKDWFEIFNNIRFTIKYVGNVEKKMYQTIMEKYHLLEVYYFIIITGNTSSLEVVEAK